MTCQPCAEKKTARLWALRTTRRSAGRQCYLMNSMNPAGCGPFGLLLAGRGGALARDSRNVARLPRHIRQAARCGALPPRRLTSTARSWPDRTHRSTVSRETDSRSAICRIVSEGPSCSSCLIGVLHGLVRAGCQLSAMPYGIAAMSAVPSPDAANHDS